MNTRALLGVALGALLGWGYLESWQVRVRRYDIFLENLPPEAQGCTIAQISDLHASWVTPFPLVRKILRLCATQNPDVVLLTGDMVARRGSYLPPIRKFVPPITDFARQLAQELTILDPPLGIWAVPGNHDLWEGSFSPIADILAEAGVRDLTNRSTTLPNGLKLVGVDDLRAGTPDVRAATQGVDPNAAQVVLNHNPRLASLFAGYNALILSGHTHGGQARLPGPLRVYPVDAEKSPWQRGFFRVGRAQLYVSVGAGVIGVPFRLGVPPEIAIFTLHNLSR